MDSKYSRTIGALMLAAKLAKDPETREESLEFIRKNQSYFPKIEKLLPENKSEKVSVPQFVPLNLKNKKA